MHAAHAETEARPAGRTFDRGLIALIVGALVLIVVGLISIPLLASRTPALAPATTPEGVVQRFYQAVYSGDYSAAYAFLSADTQREFTLIELQQQMSAELQQSQMRVGTTAVHDSSATVQVTVTHFVPGGPFGSNEWSEMREILLQRENDTWKIVSGPFYVPEVIR